MKSKTLNPIMTNFSFDTIDKHSVLLCAVTFVLNAFIKLLAITTLSSVASWVAIVAGISTCIYNAIRIRKELPKRKVRRK